MSRRWSEREMEVLSQLAKPGVSSREITRLYNQSRGCRKRTHGALICKMNELRLSYARRYIPWSVDEHRVLTAMAGRCTIPEIQAALIDECGIERTQLAIRDRLQERGISAMPDEDAWLSTTGAARALACVPNSVIGWCRKGTIPTGGDANKRWIRPSDILAFIDAQPMRFNPAIMPPGPFRNRVEVRQREGRYLTIEQAHAICGVHTRDISMACLRGDLVAHRARHGRDGGQPRHWIKAADLALWHAQIPLKVAS